MREPIVLVPGFMCDARVFGPQVAALSVDTPVMVMPATGGERIEEIASAVITAAPPKFALAGTGFGGIIAMEVLRRAPDRVTRIALMDTTPLPETPADAAERETRIIAARAGRLNEMMEEEIRRNGLAASPYRNDVMALVKDMAQHLGGEVFAAQSRAIMRRKDQQATMRRCKVPALVTCGAGNAALPVKRHSFMAELIPHARLEVIEGAGYLPSLEQPEAVINVLRAWQAQPFVLQ